MWSVLRHRNYRLYWLGQFPSVLGHNMEYVSLAWLVLHLTNSPMALGLAGLVQSAPQIALLFVGGVVADRSDRRRLLILTQGATALLFGCLGLMVVADVAEFWQVLVLAFLLGCVRAFDQPSRQGLLPLLVPREEIPNAIPLGNLVWQTTRLVGPAVAGVLIATTSVGVALLVAGAAFVIALSLFSMINLTGRTTTHEGRGLLNDMLGGLAFVRRNELFAILLGMTFFNSVFGLPYVILMPVVARDVLQVGADGYGFLQTAGGIGALAGTLAVARLAAGRVERQGLQILVGGGAFGVLIIAFAFSSSYPLSLALLFVMGAANQLYMTSVNTTLQLNVPDEYRGRVMAIWGLTWSLMPLGGTIAGAVAQAAGPSVALALGGTLVAAMAVFVAVASPRVRQLNWAVAVN